MALNEDMITRLKQKFGFSDEPFQDKDGYWTIGYGHRINDTPGGEAPQTTWSESYADDELRSRVAAAGRPAAPSVQTSQSRHAPTNRFDDMEEITVIGSRMIPNLSFPRVGYNDSRGNGGFHAGGNRGSRTIDSTSNPIQVADNTDAFGAGAEKDQKPFWIVPRPVDVLCDGGKYMGEHCEGWVPGFLDDKPMFYIPTPEDLARLPDQQKEYYANYYEAAGNGAGALSALQGVKGLYNGITRRLLGQAGREALDSSFTLNDISRAYRNGMTYPRRQ